MTQKELMEYLHYDPDTGVFTWIKKPARRIPIGAEAGYVNPHGYRQIKLYNQAYPAHRLAWLYVHGSMPEEQIDHINRMRDDNRLCNLREASPSNNTINAVQTKERFSKYKGVFRADCISKPYLARIIKQGVLHHLGLFKDEIEAARAYDKAAKELFGEFAYVNGV